MNGTPATSGWGLYAIDRVELKDTKSSVKSTPEVHLVQYHLAQKRPLSAILFRAKFNHPKVHLAQNSVL